MMYECEYPAQQRIQKQFLTRVGDILADQAVEPTERDTIVDFWRNSHEYNQQDSQLASALMSIAGHGTNPYTSLTHTPLNEALAELGLGKRTKAINKGIHDAACEFHHALYVNRAKTSALPKRTTSELNDKITDIFTRGYLSHNTLTLLEVLEYRRKDKIKFVRTYSKYSANTTTRASTRRPWEEAPRTRTSSIIVGCRVRTTSLSTESIKPTEGIVNSTDQHSAIVEWTHPSGEHTLEWMPSSRVQPMAIGALGHNQEEANVIDTKFKRSPRTHTEYVCKIDSLRTDTNLATYTTIDTDGVVRSTPHDIILTAQRLALIPSRIVCKQRKRSVLHNRKMKLTIPNQTTEQEVSIAPTKVSVTEGSQTSSDADESSSGDDCYNPATPDTSADNPDDDDHSLTAKQILHDSAD